MTLLTLLYISGGICLVMFLYHSLELVTGIRFIPKKTRKGIDTFALLLLNRIKGVYQKIAFLIVELAKKVLLAILLVLISAWMWALRFTIKIVSLLQGRNGSVRSVVRGHLEAIQDYKRHLQEED